LRAAAATQVRRVEERRADGFALAWAFGVIVAQAPETPHERMPIG
jgi:hypothetical protein